MEAEMNQKDNLETSKAEEKKPAAGLKSFRVALIVLLSCVLVVSTCMLIRSWKGANGSFAESGQSSTTRKPTQSTQSTQNTTTKPSTTENTSTNTTVSEPAQQIIDLRFWEYPEEVWLIGEAGKAYMQSDAVENVGDFLRPYFQSGERNDVWMPVELGFTIHSLPDGYSVTDVVFQLSESEDFSDATEYVPQEGTYSVFVYGLYTGRQYYCRAFVTLSDGSVQVLGGSFYTAASPRVLTIDGIVNVRDIGGWKTTDGKMIRQGLLYRGSELDGMIEPDYKLTETGITQMREMLGIRMDMDLRHAGENVLGEDVKHVCYSAIQYSGIFADERKEAVRRVFADLANPENYPIYMHCTYGADRTGTICYLLEALLGVSDADLMRDYELTGLTYQYVSESLMDPFVEEMAAYEGETTMEKVENYLLSIGVTEEEIASIRQIFLEDES